MKRHSPGLTSHHALRTIHEVVDHVYVTRRRFVVGVSLDRWGVCGANHTNQT